MITLFDFWRSSAAYRVRIGLNQLSLPYTSVAVDLTTGAHRSPENLARNPQGLVPTLDIDGLRLTQSLAMLEYLDETRGGLLPQGAGPRAHVRALAYAIAMEIAPVCALSVRNQVAELTEGRTSAADWQRHHYARGLAAFEAMLTDAGTCCFGDQVSIADCCLVPQIYNADQVGIDVTSFPKLQRIVTDLRQRPAFAAAHPENVKP